MFSDDPAWARACLRLPGPVAFVDDSGAEPDYEDLRLMTSCRHFIIANSTFSWWGAWLAGNEHKIVVAPRRWFADPRRCTKDIAPKPWLLI